MRIQAAGARSTCWPVAAAVLLVDAFAAAALSPGRYRLHAVMARSPQDHILAEAVTLKLTAGRDDRAARETVALAGGERRSHGLAPAGALARFSLCHGRGARL